MRGTKEMIMMESLALFSKKGYDGVSMSDIADAVGIKAASIYKHYTGKEEIFGRIVECFEERTDKIFNPVLSDTQGYIEISIEMLIQMIQQTFQQYAKEPFLSQCRKLFMISSFARPETGKLYTKYFIEQPMKYQSELFKEILKGRGQEGKDTDNMAYHFYTPILVLLQEYDYKSISMEDALERIKALVTQFAEVYDL